MSSGRAWAVSPLVRTRRTPRKQEPMHQFVVRARLFNQAGSDGKTLGTMHHAAQAKTPCTNSSHRHGGPGLRCGCGTPCTNSGHRPRGPGLRRGGRTPYTNSGHRHGGPGLRCGGGTPCTNSGHRSGGPGLRRGGGTPCTNSGPHLGGPACGVAADPHAPARQHDAATTEGTSVCQNHPVSGGALAAPATSNAGNVLPDRQNPIHREAAARGAERDRPAAIRRHFLNARDNASCTEKRDTSETVRRSGRTHRVSLAAARLCGHGMRRS